jgi:thiol:disulfide interchange protein DsbD
MEFFMRFKKITLLITLILLSLSLFAKDAKPTIDASYSIPSCKKGEYGILTIAIAIPKGYHLYSMTKIDNGPKPLRVSLNKQLSPEGGWFAPVPQKEFDKNFNKELYFYDKQVAHTRVYQCLSGGTIPLKLSGQICNEKHCLAFHEEKTVKITLLEGTARSEYSVPPTLKGAEIKKEIKKVDGGLENKGLIGLIILAFLAGLGALLTPCVFPMIPITISFFSKFQKVSLRRAFLMASMYAGSIIVTFTFIGVVVSLIFGAVGMQVLSSSPFFNIFQNHRTALFVKHINTNFLYCSRA